MLGVYEIACLSSSNLKDKMFRITIKALSLSKTVVIFTGYVYQNHPQLSLQVHNDILQMDSVCFTNLFLKRDKEYDLVISVILLLTIIVRLDGLCTTLKQGATN